MYNDVGTTHLRDGCFVCPMDKDGNRPKLVVKGAFIVCSQCERGFADATPENVDHLNSKLCEDEGCPHHGTPHVCNPTKE